MKCWWLLCSVDKFIFRLRIHDFGLNWIQRNASHAIPQLATWTDIVETNLLKLSKRKKNSRKATLDKQRYTFEYPLFRDKYLRGFRLNEFCRSFNAETDRKRFSQKGFQLVLLSRDLASFNCTKNTSVVSIAKQACNDTRKKCSKVEKIENRKRYHFVSIEKMLRFLLLQLYLQCPENDTLLSIYLATLYPHILRIFILLDPVFCFSRVTVISTKSEVCRIREREKAFRLVRRAQAPLRVWDEHANLCQAPSGNFSTCLWSVVSLFLKKYSSRDIIN